MNQPSYAMMHACLRALAVTWLAAAVACQSPADKLAGTIREKEKELLSDSSMTVNRDKARALTSLYDEYATAHPGDSIAVEYLFRAGDLANGSGDYLDAIRFYQRCAETETFHKRQVALFMQGFIYENQLLDLDNARRIYTEFLERYPDHDLAKDARFSLENLGRTPEDLIRDFERRDSLARAGDTSATL